MANQLLKGRSFSPGDTVDAADLNNLVDLATALDGIIANQNPAVSAATNDYIILTDTSDGGVLRKALVSTLPGAGTVTSVSLTATPTSVFGPTGPPVTNSGTLTVSLDNQGGRKVLAAPADGTSGTPSFRVLTPADLPSATVQNISASTIDCTLGNVFNKTLTVASNTFHLTNGDSGQVIKVRVQQTPAGTATLAWVADSGSIRWPSGTAPVLTTGGGHIDMFEFVCMGGNAFYGIRWGKDML